MKVFNTIITYDKGSIVENYVSEDFPSEENILGLVKRGTIEYLDGMEVEISHCFTTDNPFEMTEDMWCEYFFVEKGTKNEVVYVCITRKEVISFKEAVLV